MFVEKIFKKISGHAVKCQSKENALMHKYYANFCMKEKETILHL